MKIAISGKMGSGKTALANVLQDRYLFHKFSFADKLKKTAMDLWGLSRDDVYGPNKKNYRKLMQDFGKHMRDVDENVWVNIILREIKAREALIETYGTENIFGDNIVIDDVRYKNEYHALKEAGFVMVRMDASDTARKRRLGDGFLETNHLSEVDLDDIIDWDMVVLNDSEDLNTLFQAADSLYSVSTAKTDNV